MTHTKKNKVLLKPSHRVIKENNRDKNPGLYFVAVIKLTKIKRSWFVIATKHYDKNGVHNGYKIPWIGVEENTWTTFIWKEHLSLWELSIAK